MSCSACFKLRSRDGVLFLMVFLSDKTMLAQEKLDAVRFITSDLKKAIKKCFNSKNNGSTW